MRILWLLLFVWIGTADGLALAEDGFVESFDGTGPFNSGRHRGLDNPDWQIGGDAQLKDGGLLIINAPNRDGADSDILVNLSSADCDCGFTSRIELRNVMMGPIPKLSVPGSISFFDLGHGFFPEGQGIGVLLRELDDNVAEWDFQIELDREAIQKSVPSGSDIAMELRYDKETSTATFVFDPNINSDESPEIAFGPYPFTASGPSQGTILYVVAGGQGVMSGLLDQWSLQYDCGEFPGDFNRDEVLDIVDIDLLTSVVRSGTNDLAFDLNSDRLVDGLDRNVWITELRRTYFGDSNLNGEFSSSDLVQVFEAAEYEDLVVGNSTWSTGDWNGDGEFTSRDLVISFTDGGYENGPRPSTPVPEPSYMWVLLASLIGFAIRDRT